MNAMISSVMGVASTDEPSAVDIFAGPRLLVPVVAIDSPGMCGQVEVVNPVTEGTALNRFTTYQVKGNISALTTDSDPVGGVFDNRKRYSDFEWLKKTLNNLFPGVRIPPLPRKQAAGRFEAPFIESRRAGLQQFLEKIFLRPQVVMHPVVIQFLKCQGDGFEITKAKWEAQTSKERQDHYLNAFVNELSSLEKPTDDGRIRNMKKFLEEHTSKLKDCEKLYARMAQNEREQMQAIGLAQEKLQELSKDESSALNAISATDRPRTELMAVLGKQRMSCASLNQDAFAPEQASGTEALLAAAEREVDDAEAMMDAISSLGGLLVNLQDAKMQVSDGEHQMRCIRESESGSLIGSLFGKDKYTQIQETKFRIERYSSEAVETQDFYLAARTMFVSSEITAFFREKIAVERWAKNEFIRRNAEQSQKISSLWSNVTGQDQASSYTGGYGGGYGGGGGGYGSPSAGADFAAEFGLS